MEKLIEMTPAWNKKATGYGVHCVDIIFVLKGELGAVEWTLFTGWYLDKDKEPGGAMLRYHSPYPKYEEQEISSNECDFLNGKPCYCDGTACTDHIASILKTEGSDGVWKYLEQWYVHQFGELK